MDVQTAQLFADNWINAWDSHDLDAILSHYADDLEFQSPMIRLLGFRENGVIRTKADLRTYFRIGLDRFPELYFQFHTCFVGINTVVIHYTSVNGRGVAEVFELNATGKAVKVSCNYVESSPS